MAQYEGQTSQGYSLEEAGMTEQQIGAYTPLQMHFLLRLKHLAEQQTTLKEEQRKKDDLYLRVVGRAVYSTYQDCIEQGLDEEAKAILQK